MSLHIIMTLPRRLLVLKQQQQERISRSRNRCGSTASAVRSAESWRSFPLLSLGCFARSPAPRLAQEGAWDGPRRLVAPPCVPRAAGLPDALLSALLCGCRRGWRIGRDAKRERRSPRSPATLWVGRLTGFHRRRSSLSVLSPFDCYSIIATFMNGNRRRSIHGRSGSPEYLLLWAHHCCCCSGDLALHDGVLFADAARGRPAADARIGSLFSDDFLRIVSSRARALANACVYGGEVEP